MQTTERPKFIWAEKYTPQILGDCVLPRAIEAMLRGYITQGEIPNLLFFGRAGLGKTTVTKVLVNELGLQSLFINGSKDSGIDTLRTTIEQHAVTVSLDGRKKVVIIDEADYLNPNSFQPALRGFIDKFQNNCRFILTCNYKNRILAPIVSRCTEIDFSVTLNKKEKIESVKKLHRRAVKILKAEGVPYDKDALLQLILRHYPDIRKTLIELQRAAASYGKIDAGALSVSDMAFSDLFAAMQTKDYAKVRQWAAERAELDAVRVYDELYHAIFDFLKDESIPAAVIAIAEWQAKAPFVAGQEVNLLGCLTEIMFGSEFNG